MKKVPSITLFFMFALATLNSTAQEEKAKKEKPKVDYRIDNMGYYWKKIAKLGYVEVAPNTKPAAAEVKSRSKSALVEDSIDVPVSNTGNDTQSEVSIFVDPTDTDHALNSNNSTGWTGSSVGDMFGTCYLQTEDFGVTWGGSVAGAGGVNSGDPAALISLTGRQYIGFINSAGGQSVSYSDDGITWTPVVAGNSAGGGWDMLDKNHLWIDNSPTSTHKGNLYNAWTDFGGSMDSEIGFVRSTDNGLSYSAPINISLDAGGSLSQGVNIKTGPNGEVYAVWSIYDSSTLNTNAYGFAKSLNGGVSFEDSYRIIDNVKGIRDTGVLKNHRVNSFPSMAVDISGGINNGTIYMVWSNTGVPGVNTGSNKSVYMIKSTDQGVTWTDPIKVNQGAFADDKEAYFGWITCDPISGVLSVIFYDDRDVTATQVETWVANSYDAGETWEDFRVSDVAFTPQPIAGLADGYMGDYLGISARDGKVYPAWPDNRNGYVQTFVSPFETNTRVKPIDLELVLNDTTGQTDLTWTFEGAPTFTNFVIYRDGVELNTTTDLFYTDMLPTHGIYTYKVTAMHTDGESSGATASIQWGNPNISVNPTALEETLNPGMTSTKTLTITNTGELELTYSIDSEIITTAPMDILDYCTATGGGDEYISGVQFGDIDNTGTTASGYADYTAMSTDVDAGGTYAITITNGNLYAVDDLGIWIDLNQDEDFEDEGENVLCLGDMGAEGTFNIEIPSSALAGSTTMRIRMKYSGSDCGSPCGTTSWGEVEDYTLNINSWLSIDTTDGTLAPGASEIINVKFDSTGLAIGDYNAAIHVASNATDSPMFEVPVVLHVALGLTSNASVDDTLVCDGAATILHANAFSGEGTYTYSWTSVPVGFTSTEANPSVTPTENTEYFVAVSDGVDVANSSVSVLVSVTPDQADMPSGDDVVFCQDNINTSYSVPVVATATSYIWTITPIAAGTIIGDSNAIEVNWSADFSGAVELSVQTQNDCGAAVDSEVLNITINEAPEVSLEAISEVCESTAAFTLIGGLPIGGVFTGTGVTAGEFDPAIAGVGIHYITYTYTNASGCEGTDTQSIYVNAETVVTLTSFADIGNADESITLTGGVPGGGVYTGTGVTDGVFDPEVAGVGTHNITYTVEGFCIGDSAVQTITVFDNISVEDITNGMTFNIYPNPNKGNLFIEINSQTERDLQVVLINQIGAVVFQKDISVERISRHNLDLSLYTSGVYFIRITGENTNFTRRIIIQK